MVGHGRGKICRQRILIAAWMIRDREKGAGGYAIEEYEGITRGYYSLVETRED
ncbi:MAG: hypothetical protein L0Y56_00300 [Nitrospira sp.]|nr:hypothetical protein [Nitrospira sp.]